MRKLLILPIFVWVVLGVIACTTDIDVAQVGDRVSDEQAFFIEARTGKCMRLIDDGAAGTRWKVVPDANCQRIVLPVEGVR